jgi:hypothetical protein
VIYMPEPLCGDPLFASWVDAKGAECVAGGEHIAPVEKRSAMAVVYWKDSLGICASSAVNAGYIVMTLGAELPADRFVSAFVQ